jgi:hypothetical protein
LFGKTLGFGIFLHVASFGSGLWNRSPTPNQKPRAFTRP